jgi:hypothetical protein
MTGDGGGCTPTPVTELRVPEGEVHIEEPPVNESGPRSGSEPQ